MPRRPMIRMRRIARWVQPASPMEPTSREPGEQVPAEPSERVPAEPGDQAPAVQGDPAPAESVRPPAPQAEKPTPQAEQPAPQVQKPAPVTEQPAPKVQELAPQVAVPSPQMREPAPQVEKPALDRVDGESVLQRLDTDTLAEIRELLRELHDLGPLSAEELGLVTRTLIRLLRDRLENPNQQPSS